MTNDEDEVDSDLQILIESFNIIGNKIASHKVVSHLFSLLAELSKNSGVNQIINQEHEPN